MLEPWNACTWKVSVCGGSFHDKLQVHVVDGPSWFYIQCVLVDTRQTTTGERRNKEKN